MRNGLVLTHQIGPWFVQQPILFNEIVKRFWRLMHSHMEEIKYRSGSSNNDDVDGNKKDDNKSKTSTSSNSSAKGNHHKRSRRTAKGGRTSVQIANQKKQRKIHSVVTVQAQPAQPSSLANAGRTITTVEAKTVDDNDNSSTSSYTPGAPPHSTIETIMSYKQEMYYNFVKESKEYNQSLPFQWANTLPCRLPELFRTSLLATGQKVNKTVTSKILFVLYASLFEGKQYPIYMSKV